MKKSLFILITFFTSICFLSHASAKTFSAQVIRVVDGDTIQIKLDGKKKSIRLYGIDAPEHDQAYGSDAAAFLKSLQGRTVDIETVSTDKHRRPVAMVFLEGIPVQEALISSGLSWVYPPYCKRKICAKWYAQEKAARKERKGLWQQNNPIAPWDWRKR